MSFPFRHIECQWQQFWHDNNSFHVDIHAETSAPRETILEMLPYPSGNLHMGHVRNYAIGDAIARFKRSQGIQVFHPMGWDSFGLPAENAAASHGVHPKVWTEKNIIEMRSQLKSLGFSYDWQSEISTCDPSYYGQEQKIFLKFFKKGLVYRKQSWVNWDPVENSVLANEQVVEGKGWRSGALVERKLLEQWSLKISDYAEELLKDLTKLTGWPERVLKMQENWIGKSVGAKVLFTIVDRAEKIEIFTTRPETLFGCSFLAIAPSHELAQEQAQQLPELAAFIEKCYQLGTSEATQAQQEKEGVFSGLHATHPLSGEKIPIYVANFVLAEYGTGALFGCPGHDLRDYEFANKYDLPIIPVISPEKTSPLPYLDCHGTMVNSDFLNGLSVSDAKTKILEEIENRNLGNAETQFRLRDWLVSRQRYWGCPIPIIHCESCGSVPVPLNDLPVALPEDVTFDMPGNPLANHPTWKYVNCPECKEPAIRETDTLDTFFESSWYYMRYLSPHAENPIDAEAIKNWLPVSHYVGGIEHAVMHLLYTRFFTKALRDCNMLKIKEPIKNLMTQGMVCHPTYKSKSGKLLSPDEVEKKDDKYIELDTGEAVHVGRQEKMGKSKKNTVVPSKIINTYGADVARLFILSDTPPEKDFDWNDDGLDGCWRYLNRIWRLHQKIEEINTNTKTNDNNLFQQFFPLMDKAKNAYQEIALNKVIAFCREATNILEDFLDKATKEDLVACFKYLLQVLNPICPHISHDIWSQVMDKKDFLDPISWPDIDQKYLKQSTVTIAVQINGKLKETITIEDNTAKDVILKNVYDLEKVRKAILNKQVKKEIVVPGRIVNLVVV